MEDNKKEKYICHECESKKVKVEFNNYEIRFKRLI